MTRHTIFLSAIIVVLSAQEMHADDRVSNLEKRIIELELRVAKLEKLLSARQPELPIQIKPGDYRNKANWRRLELGMTKAQVKAILGDPPHRRVLAGFDSWYYPDVLGPQVQFDLSGKLSGWEEPE